MGHPAPGSPTLSLVKDSDDARPGWIKWLMPWVMRHWVLAVVGLIGATIGMVGTSLIPVVQKVVLDNVVVKHQRALFPLLVMLAAIGVIRFGATFSRRLAGGAVAYRVQEDLRNAVFDHLLGLDFAHHDELQTGQLVSRANTDVNMVFGVLQMISIIIGNLVMLVVSLAIMFVLSPLLAVIAAAAILVTFAVAWRMRHEVYVSTWDASQREAEMTAAAEEAISGVRVVKGFGQEDRELSRFAAALDHLFGGRVRNVRIRARFTSVLQAVPVLGQVVVLAVGGWLALHGHITLGTLLAFFTYLTQLAAPARMLAVFLAAAQQARSGVERLRDLLGAQSAIVDRDDAVSLGTVAGAVTFDDVTFGYGDGPPILDHFTMHIAPGERVALVGASGSGKSTATLLLPRFYDVTAGSISIDGIDVRDATLKSLRSQIGSVFEQAFLFAESFRDNIAYGRMHATDDEVVAAARAAQAHDFIIATPQGYDTVIGEGGATLSGGQRQRLALARLLLRDPAVVILDDATSSVDARVEELIHHALHELLEGRTTLLVAHRRSTLALADRVVVVDHGRVVDQGSHTELQARSSLYRSLLSSVDDAEDDPADGDAAEEHGLVRARPVAAPEPVAADGVGAPLAGAVPTARLDAGLRRPGGGGGGMGQGSMGWIGPPSEDLLASVAALPPILDRSLVNVADHVVDEGGLHLWTFMKRWRRELGFGLLFVALDALATLAVPVLIKSGIDRGVAGGSLAALLAISVVAFVIATFDTWFMWMENLVTGRASERILVALRVRVFAQLQRLGLDFYEREMSGRLLSRLTSDVDTLSELLQSGFVNAAVSIAMFLGMVVVLLALSVPLALSVFAVTVPLVVATFVYQHYSRPAYDRQRDAIASVLADLQENLTGVRVTQALQRESLNEDRFHLRDREFRDAGMMALRVQVTYFAFVELLSMVGIIVVLGVGSALHDRQALTVGVLIAFLLYLTQFFTPIQQLSQVFDSWQSAAAGMRKIDAVLAERSTVPIPAHPVPIPPGLGDIVLDDVHFAYSGQADEALAGIDLTVPGGQRVALVGQTGSGKTTLVKLLARFHDPTSGTAYFDGVDLRDLDPGEHRRRLGYVPQEPFLFAGTIRDNLVYGRPDASEEEVQSAVTAVGIESLLASVPGGLDHWLIERGRSLSTGQRQLLCLARALVADPVLLLLDEATSNLDLASEARIERAMDVLSEGRTTLVIAHRLATAARADRILVLAHGKIIEDGTQQELLDLGGRYRGLWDAYEGFAEPVGS